MKRIFDILIFILMFSGCLPVSGTGFNVQNKDKLLNRFEIEESDLNRIAALLTYRIDSKFSDDRYVFIETHIPIANSYIIESEDSLCYTMWLCDQNPKDSKECFEGKREDKFIDVDKPIYQYTMFFKMGNPIAYENNEIAISFLETGGWESEPIVFLMWEKQDSRRILKGISREVQFTSPCCSKMGVDSVIKIGQDKYLICGTTEGGDEFGGSGKESWFVYWRLPYDCKIIYAIGTERKEDNLVMKESMLKLDDSFNLKIESYSRNELDKNDSALLKIDEKSVNLKAIMDLVDKNVDLLEIHKSLGIYDERRDLEKALSKAAVGSKDYAFILRLLKQIDTSATNRDSSKRR